MEPTKYGTVLIDCGVAVFDDLRQGLKQIEFLSDPTAGELRIGSTGPIASSIILAVINRLIRRYPRMVINVVTGNTETLLDDLHERRIDLAVTRMIGPFSEPDLDLQVLFEDAFVVVAGIQSPWTRRRKVELAQLVNEHWTLAGADTLSGSLVMEAFRAKGLEHPKAVVISNSLDVRKGLLATGRFLSILPNFVLKISDQRLPIKALPIELASTRRPIVVATLKNRTPNTLLQPFIEAVRVITTQSRSRP